MRPNPGVAFRRSTFWTCPSCVQSQTFHDSTRAYINGPRTVRLVKNRRSTGKILFAAAGGTVTGGILLFGEELKQGTEHYYHAAQRTGRVVSTLTICINDYRRTLRTKTDTPEDATTLLKACHKRCAVRTLGAMEKNGSIFIKLGQHLSSMGYLLPTEWTETFIPLQDKCPVSSYDSIEDMFLRDTGHRIEDDFSEFSKDPIGAASLAQVHTAVLKNSTQKVAVKVQHPHLEEWVPLDLALTRFTFRSLKRAFPDYDMEWLSEEMESSLPQELDFEQEGNNATMARKYFERHCNFPLVIPKVISARKRILVMDFVKGARIDDHDYLDQHNISRDEVSATLARIFNVMIFQSKAPLHCDPHGGNMAILHNPHRRYPYNFDIIMYDHGLYRMPEEKLRRSYAHLWLSVIDADEKGMRKYAYEVAGITDDQFPLFASAITGRDYRVLTRKEVSTSVRDANEKDAINEVFGEDLIQQLVQLLGRVPRIILLILKTNDLTRSLDESLGSPEPMRPMLILAKYASRTVWQEQKELIWEQGHYLKPRNLFLLFRAFLEFARVELKLFAFERYLSIRRHLHLGQVQQ